MAYKENNKTLQAAIVKVRVYQDKKKTADNAPALERILRFTTALDDYAEDILVPRESINQTKNSTSVPTVSEERRTVPQMARRASVSSRTSSIRVFATRPGYSSSSNPNTSSRYSTEISSSTSGASTRESVAPRGSSQKSASAAQRADTAIERPGMNPREYINDPNGTILSPPIIKNHPADKPSTKRAQVGRHTISLSAKTFQLNDNKLEVISYAAADAFFQEVIHREDMLDELNGKLSGGCQEGWYYHTSDWQIEIGGIRIQGHRLS
jgi:hypothetical protein